MALNDLEEAIGKGLRITFKEYEEIAILGCGMHQNILLRSVLAVPFTKKQVPVYTWMLH